MSVNIQKRLKIMVAIDGSETSMRVQDMRLR